MVFLRTLTVSTVELEDMTLGVTRVIFAKGVFDIATRNAINTTSEKKVLKLIEEEGFALES